MIRYKKKYHVGRISSGYRCVFDIVELKYTPAKYYVELFINRSRDQLMPLIINKIRPVTIIWSDEWWAYTSLRNLGYGHNTVNHQVNFINHSNGAHTQNVESLWNRLKK
ncbi:hypothetical protein DMUE_1710 [Dictyocoela muelleri]|nr:hypothetical protein DMUE_1710 [Dictyocoela muelleri]